MITLCFTTLCIKTNVLVYTRSSASPPWGGGGVIYMKKSRMFFVWLVMRVPNRFFGIRDLAYFKTGIRGFEGKGERDSGL